MICVSRSFYIFLFSGDVVCIVLGVMHWERLPKPRNDCKSVIFVSWLGHEWHRLYSVILQLFRRDDVTKVNNDIGEELVLLQFNSDRIIVKWSENLVYQFERASLLFGNITKIVQIYQVDLPVDWDRMTSSACWGLPGAFFNARFIRMNSNNTRCEADIVFSLSDYVISTFQ